MRHTIEVLFEKEMKAEGVSTFIAFVRAVRGRGFDRNLVGRFFNKLVDKEDYTKSERDTLLLFACALPPKNPNV
jgi:hypothetical protein